MRQSLMVVGGWSLALAAALAAAAADKGIKKESAAPPEGERQAREHVEQALLAEARGDNAERTRRLREALVAAPDLPEANWHAARVFSGGAWLPLAQVTSQTAGDPDWTQYRDLRGKAGASPKALRDLARWCSKRGWHDVAAVHFAQLLASPASDAEMKQEAVKALDLKATAGGWITAAELRQRQEQAQAVEAALARWRPVLVKLQAAIDGENFAARDKAIAELHQLDDPASIPALESLLAGSGPRFQEEAVRRLASFPHFEATEALVRYAVLSEYSLVRRDARAALRQRDEHDYVPLLLGGLAAPLEARYQVVWDSRGRIGYTHALLREGPSGNLLLVSHELARPVVTHRRVVDNQTVRVFAPEQAKSESRTVVFGTTPQQAFRNQLAAAAAQAENVQTQVRMANSAVDQANERLFETLEQTTGQQWPRQPLEWWKWWQSYNEYQWPRPTQYAYRWNASNYYAQSTSYTQITGTRSYSCFLAGTPVRTQTGPAAIETIRPGDRVLAQDADSGELAYWVSGHGWKMAKQLAVGDLLHGLGGAVPVEAVEPAADARAYNLVVDDYNSYFVGQAGLLVHDNEFRRPTRAIVPGLVQSEPLAAK
jgi:hypothetical protein